MKKTVGLSGLFYGGFVAGLLAQAVETYTVVRVSNFDGTMAIESLGSAALTELRKDVALENKLVKDAYQAVARDWRKAHEGKTVKQTINYKNIRREVEVKAPITPFPLKTPKPRVISQAGTFPTAEAAAEKKRALEAIVKPVAPEKAEEEEKAQPKSSGKRERVTQAEIDQLYNDMMSELAKLKQEAASGKGGK